MGARFPAQSPFRRYRYRHQCPARNDPSPFPPHCPDRHRLWNHPRHSRGRQYEVATFRQDLDYKDGRRPTRIEFTTAVEDAKRRDFTINGMFYDPLKEEIFDYVQWTGGSGGKNNSRDWQSPRENQGRSPPDDPGHAPLLPLLFSH